MFSKYKIRLKNCCPTIAIMTGKVMKGIKYDLSYRFEHDLTARLGVRIDTVLCRYCPYCGKEFEIEWLVN